MPILFKLGAIGNLGILVSIPPPIIKVSERINRCICVGYGCLHSGMTISRSIPSDTSSYQEYVSCIAEFDEGLNRMEYFFHSPSNSMTSLGLVEYQ